LVLGAVEGEGPELAVVPLLARGLLELVPGDRLVADRDPSEEWRATDLAAAAAEELDLLLVPLVQPSAAAAEEVPSHVHADIARNEADVVPSELLVTLRAGAGKLDLAHQLGQFGPVDLDLDLLQLVAEFTAGRRELEGNLVHPRMVSSPGPSPGP